VNYFSECRSQIEARSVFRKLCFKFHPDKGGDTKQMINLEQQYRLWCSLHPKDVDCESQNIDDDDWRFIDQEKRIRDQSHYISLLEKCIEKRNDEIDSLNSLIKHYENNWSKRFFKFCKEILRRKS
jgi:CDP-glycerol glycerophosphotransferase (TagB/SpsB family)